MDEWKIAPILSSNSKPKPSKTTEEEEEEDVTLVIYVDDSDIPDVIV